MTKRASLRAQAGFSMIEILLAVVVFGFVTSAVIGAIIYGRSSNADAGDRVRAMQLADEGVQGVRNIKDAAFSNLIDGTYGLVQAGNIWTLSGSSDTNGIYTRQVTIATVDAKRKSATVNVSWLEGSSTSQVSVTSQLASWTAPIKTWPNAVLAGSADVTGTNNGTKTRSVGNYAYTVFRNTTNNFVISNISNPALPVNTAVVTIPGTPVNLFISGNYAYVVNDSDTAEFQVIDISNPATPVVKATLDLAGTGNGQGVYVNGTTAYLVRSSDATAGANELVTINVASPLAPVVLGGYSGNITMNEVYVSGTNVFVATASTTAEMQIFNASVPATPTLTSSYNAPTAVAALTITGYANTVLLGTSTALDAINVTTLTAPALLGAFTAAGIINDIDVDSTRLFAFLGTSATAAEFQVVNIGTPASMTLAKTVDVPGTLSTVAGVGYNSTLELVVGASAADTQEIVTFVPN